MLLAVLEVTDNEFLIVGAAFTKEWDSKSENASGRHRRYHQTGNVRKHYACPVGRLWLS